MSVFGEVVARLDPLIRQRSPEQARETLAAAHRVSRLFHKEIRTDPESGLKQERWVSGWQTISL